MAVATARGALDALQGAIDSLEDLAAADLGRCTAALVEHAGAHGAGIFDRVNDHLEPLASTGQLPRSIDRLTAEVLESGVPIQDGPLLAAPVHCPQSVHLVLIADIGEEDHQALAVLVRSAAHQISLRLELLDTRRRLHAAEVRSETLASATQVLGRTLELQEVFSAILGQLRLVVPYDSASVQHLEGDRLQIIGGDGFPNLEEILSLSFDITAEDNPNRLVIEHREPLVLRRAPEHYPAFREDPHMPAGIESWLGVPLEFGDRIIGMLSIDSRQPDFYDEGHARIARAFAAQAAIAIENARMFGEMRRMATHDTLTGLPNRRHLEDVGAEAVAQVCREGRSVAMLMFDLDGFKVINDTHGHAVGDDVLCEVADRVRAGVRPQDMVARIGGDEFVALLPDADEAASLAIAERLRSSVAERAIDTTVGPLGITISVGVTIRSAGQVTMEEMLRAADRAMYSAKGHGRDRVEAA